MRSCHFTFSLLLLTAALLYGPELQGKCSPRPKLAQAGQEDQDKIEQSHARLLSAIQSAAKKDRTPIELPSKVFPGDEKSFRAYEQSFFEIERETDQQVSKLKELASGHLDTAEKKLREDEATIAQADLALAAQEQIAAEDFVGFEFPADTNESLKKIQKVWADQYGKILSKRDGRVKKISQKYVSDVSRLIENAKKSGAKIEDIELLVNYRRLISARCDEKSLEGQFFLFADSGEIPKLYRGGKSVQIGPDGVSKKVRLDLISDHLSLEFDSDWKKSSVFMAFVSTDRELQIVFHPSDLKGLIGLNKGRDATRSKISNAENSPTAGKPLSVYKKRAEKLKLIEKKDLWFQVDPEIVSVWGVALAPEMLKSVHGALTRKSVPSFDMTGIDVLQLNPAKKVLLIHVGSNGWKGIVSECKKRGLEVDATGKYDPELKSYSKYHTIILGENALRKFGGQPVSDHMKDFILQGGHLLSLGTYNGENARAAFQDFGIGVGATHTHSFKDHGLASALLFLGTEDRIPADKHLSSTGNIRCEIEHTVMLDRGPGAKSGRTKMLTMNVGKGRFTYTQIQPSYRGGNWFVSTLVSWISRGSPAPPNK